MQQTIFRVTTISRIGDIVHVDVLKNEQPILQQVVYRLAWEHVCEQMKAGDRFQVPGYPDLTFEQMRTQD